MFGRKKYDEESGDYIRPVEEYRDDCEEYHDHEQTYEDYDSRRYEREYRQECNDHEHGQTYRDYDSRRSSSEYRKECDDTKHGQTYKNYNSEQHDYEKAEGIENRFYSELMPGEQIFWTGSTVKNAKMSELGPTGCFMAIPIIIMIFAFSMIIRIVTTISQVSAEFNGGTFILPMIMPAFIMPLIVIIAIIFMRRAMGRSMKAHYAITDRRVIKLGENSNTSVQIANITNIRKSVGANGVGYVSYTVIYPNNFGARTTSIDGIFGIKDPNVPYSILCDVQRRINEQKRMER